MYTQVRICIITKMYVEPKLVHIYRYTSLHTYVHNKSFTRCEEVSYSKLPGVGEEWL